MRDDRSVGHIIIATFCKGAKRIHHIFVSCCIYHQINLEFMKGEWEMIVLCVGYHLVWAQNTIMPPVYSLWECHSVCGNLNPILISFILFLLTLLRLDFISSSSLSRDVPRSRAEKKSISAKSMVFACPCLIPLQSRLPLWYPSPQTTINCRKSPGTLHKYQTHLLLFRRRIPFWHQAQLLIYHHYHHQH